MYRIANGRHDVHIARAATEVAGNRLADLVVIRLTVVKTVSSHKRVRGHNQPRSAVAALKSVRDPECLLKNGQASVCSRQTLERRHAPAVRLDREDRAGLHVLVVEEDRTRAAARGVAPYARARQAGDQPEEMDKQHSRSTAPVTGAPLTPISTDRFVTDHRRR